MGSRWLLQDHTYLCPLMSDWSQIPPSDILKKKSYNFLNTDSSGGCSNSIEYECSDRFSCSLQVTFLQHYHNQY